MTSQPQRAVRDLLSEYVERVSEHHERVVVTKNGREAAVLMSVDDLESLEETLEILGDIEVVAQLLTAIQEVERGEAFIGHRREAYRRP